MLKNSKVVLFLSPFKKLVRPETFGLHYVVRVKQTARRTSLRICIVESMVLRRDGNIKCIQ